VVGVLTGGDDNAFVACLPPDAPLPSGAVVVGEVSEGSGVMVDGMPYQGAQGWDHYRRR